MLFFKMAVVDMYVLLPCLYCMILTTTSLPSLGYYKIPTCLEVCLCDDIILRINCSGTMMQALPSDLSGEYISLYLNYNNFTRLTTENFNISSLQPLRELSLVESNVMFVENGTLSVLTELISLDMRKNHLEIVPYGISEMIKLQFLDLRSNSIELIPSQSFLNHNRLRALFLDDNLLDLTQIERGTFSSLVMLRKLTISGEMPYSTYEEFYDFNSSISADDVLFTNYSQCVNVSSWFDRPKRNLSLVLLDISNNTITCLADSSFSKWFFKLQILDLSSNQLEYVPDDIFTQLDGLEELYLYQNKLRHIPDTFSNTLNLRILNLKRNQLLYLSPITISPLSNSLVVLDVSRNLFQIWDATSTAIFDQLLRLSIRGNKISEEDLPLHFNNIPCLKSLRLDYNRLKYFPNITGLRYLEELKISYNRIRELPEHAFGGCESLKYIYLNSNLLRTIPKYIVIEATELKTLEISDNPLKCDCNIKWLYDGFEGQLPKDAFQYSLVETSTCGSPKFLKNTSLIEAFNFHYGYLICSNYPDSYHMILLITVWISLLALIVSCKLYQFLPGSGRHIHVPIEKETVLEDDSTLIELLNNDEKLGKCELVRESEVELVREQSSPKTVTAESKLPPTSSKLRPTPTKLDEVNWHTLPETPV